MDSPSQFHHSQAKEQITMPKEIVSTERAPAAVGPYSQGVRIGNLVFTAGQLGLVPGTKEFAGPDIESQTRQALENIKAVLEAASSCLEHVVKTTVFLADMGEFARMNGVYAEYFVKAPPARSAVQVAALPLGGRVEIEAVAEVCDCESREDDCDCDCG
jgi:2-iminobutanoate/2-iminopropanoate deaminase